MDAPTPNPLDPARAALAETLDEVLETVHAVEGDAAAVIVMTLVGAHQQMEIAFKLGFATGGFAERGDEERAKMIRAMMGAHRKTFMDFTAARVQSLALMLGFDRDKVMRCARSADTIIAKLEATEKEVTHKRQFGRGSGSSSDQG